MEERRMFAGWFGMPLAAALAVGGFCGVVRAGDDAFDLSLSELLDQEVTTVSRKSERLGDAPSAIYVLTADELSRLGVTSLPEALRHVPGVQVAALGRNRWAVSIRGFNGRFANRLQVLVDGRSVYSPLFSGTFWEALDIPLGDIERIEVVRGPGGAQWGANAVNGVINIITRHSRATRGTELRAATGKVSRRLMDLRHGGDWGEHGSYRISLRSRDDRAGDEVGGEAGNDSWRSTRLGLRADRDGIGGGSLTVVADAYRADSGDHWLLPDPSAPGFVNDLRAVQRNEGASMSLRWSRQLAARESVDVQADLAYDGLDMPGVIVSRRTTASTEAQYRFAAASRHDIVLGGGLRHTYDRLDDTPVFSAIRADVATTEVSAFINDEISLIAERLSLVAGLKYEHHEWTGDAWQPSLRLAWRPSSRHTVWLAASRAVRTPARVERDIDFTLYGLPPFTGANPTAFYGLGTVTHAPDLRAEVANAYELGYRGQLGPGLLFDAAAFSQHYRRMRSVSYAGFLPGFVGAPGLVPDYLKLFYPVDFVSSAMTSGLELSLEWQPTPRVRLSADYTRLHVGLRSSGDAVRDEGFELYAMGVPREQFGLRSSFKVADGRYVNFDWRHVGALANGLVPAYEALDVHLAWRLSKRTELGVTLRNLLDDHHLEFVPDYVPSASMELGRSVLIGLSMGF